MELKTKQQIRRFANSFVVTVPKAYVDDGNLKLGTEYEIVFRPVTVGFGVSAPVYEVMGFWNRDVHTVHI